MFVQLFIALVLAHLAWSLVALEINVRKARALNVPVVRLPVDPVNFLWIFLQGYVWALLDRLPIPWSSYPDFIRFSYRGWHFREKSHPAVRFGPVWALVTPVTFYLHFTDPDAIRDLFVRRSDFIRPTKNYSKHEIYLQRLDLYCVANWHAEKNCSKFMDRASPRPDGMTGRVIARCLQRHSTRALCTLSGTRLSVRPLLCCDIGLHPIKPQPE